MPRKRDVKGSTPKESRGEKDNWPHWIQRIVLIGLGAENFYESYRNFSGRPLLAVLNLGIALTISATVILTWPKRPWR